MGIYIEDLDDMDKEMLLNRFGMKIGMGLKWENVPPNMLPVCLVDNGAFKAAGVAFSKEELEAFQYPDSRPKKMYLVTREAIDNMLGDLGVKKLDKFIANSQS